MIPMIMRIKVKSDNKKAWRFWIPLPILYVPVFILVFLLSPILLATILILTIVKGTGMIRMVPALLMFISALSGLYVDITSKNSKVYFSIQ